MCHTGAWRASDDFRSWSFGSDLDSQWARSSEQRCPCLTRSPDLWARPPSVSDELAIDNGCGVLVRFFSHSFRLTVAHQLTEDDCSLASYERYLRTFGQTIAVSTIFSPFRSTRVFSWRDSCDKERNLDKETLMLRRLGSEPCGLVDKLVLEFVNLRSQTTDGRMARATAAAEQRSSVNDVLTVGHNK